MANSLRTRVAKLHSDAISDVSSQIVIAKGKEVLREVWRGTNANKVIRIVVRL